MPREVFAWAGKMTTRLTAVGHGKGRDMKHAKPSAQENEQSPESDDGSDAPQVIFLPNFTPDVLRLVAELQKVFGAPTPSSPSIDRDKYTLAFMAIAHFADAAAAHFPDAAGLAVVADEFAELGSTFQDLNKGVQRPLVTPFDPGCRRGDSSDVWRARAKVAIGIAALIRTGMSRDEAARFVAKNYPEIEKLAGKRAKGGPSAFKSWYDKFHFKTQKNSEASAVFAQGLIDLGRLDPEGLMTYGKFAFEQARSFALSLSGE
jgi:hypothetical protein